jgi:hypothetical protein
MRTVAGLDLSQQGRVSQTYESGASSAAKLRLSSFRVRILVLEMFGNGSVR